MDGTCCIPPFETETFGKRADENWIMRRMFSVKKPLRSRQDSAGRRWHQVPPRLSAIYIYIYIYKHKQLNQYAHKYIKNQ